MLRGSLASLDALESGARVRLIALTWNFENEIGTPASRNSFDGLKPSASSCCARWIAAGSPRTSPI